MVAPTSQSSAISCRSVTKSYRTDGTTVPALRGIDLEVRSGELMMLVGPSGSGKTTLISVIAGILDQDDGDCVVFDQDLKRMADSERTRFRAERIGFVFQAFNLLPTLTAAENVAVPLLIQGVPRRQAVERASELLGRVGLGDRLGSIPSQLSGGQAQRVAIARALVHDPKLIVCDEPTSSLDHETGLRVMELMRSLGLGDGRTLVVVTHDARIFPFADRIAHLDDGRVVNIESPLPASKS